MKLKVQQHYITDSESVCSPPTPPPPTLRLSSFSLFFFVAHCLSSTPLLSLSLTFSLSFTCSHVPSLPLCHSLSHSLSPSLSISLSLPLSLSLSLYLSLSGMMHAPYRATSVGGSIFNGLTLIE